MSDITGIGDVSNISVEALDEVSTFMNLKLKQTLTTNLQVIIDVYNSLRNTAALSNEEIDVITAQIASQITKINENYEDLLNRFNATMQQTSSEVTTSTENITSGL